ncbi:MAG: CHASE domain-containing protein [Betaproteobacteria bacterium]|nr:CHASE domain-containing protein [Betaproteobacteria bacterium]
MSNPAPDGAATDGPAVRAVRRWPAWALLCAGLAVTVMLTLWVKQGLDQDAGSLRPCQRPHRAASPRAPGELRTGLIGARALFAGSQKVTRDDWRQYVSLLLQEPRIASVQGIGYAQLIAPGELQAHIAQVRAEGYPDYAVRPPGARDTYTAIVFLEPFKDRNLRAFGYDMYSEPVRRDAMARARDSGQAQLSGKVRLVQETDSEAQAGVLMYVPVYRQEMPLQTVEQRRAALLGWTYSPYRMNDLMRGILGDWQGALGVDLDLHIFDGEQASPQALLYASDAASRAAPHPHEVTEMRRLDFNGRRWRLEFRAHSLGDSQSYASVWRTLAGGFAISVLMCWLALSLIGTRELAVRIAAGLTADIRSREAQLKESELRWKFALEGSDLGVWDWDIERSTVLFSRIWKQMLGHTEGEIGNSLDEWERLVHPEDLPATLAEVQDYLDGKVATYNNVHRVRCKDGSYKWIRDRGMVVERDP